MTEPIFDVVIVGSANLDLVANLDHLPMPGETLIALGYAEYPGGKGVNQAVACARMGATTAFVGCVGNDDAGSLLRSVLEGEGIDTSHLRTVDVPTGRAFINVDNHGENAIVVVAGANALVGKEEQFVIPRSRVVLAQLEVPLETIEVAFSQARSNGAVAVLNPAPARDIPKSLLSLANIVVPNETESAAIGGTENLLNLGATTVITTLGADGASIESTSSNTHIAPYNVTPVDTVGAGDAFIGATCAELSRGASIEDAARMGAIAGALTTTVKGAVPSLPTRQAVLAAQKSVL
ncbi:MAG: ribokinase [Actinomycetes bacterium]